MKQRLYLIYDVKAEAPIGVIQWLSTDAQAIRMFEQVCRTPDTLCYTNPEDFVLLFVGTLDFSSCVIEPNVLALSAPIMTGVNVARALTRARDESDIEKARAAGGVR